MKKKKILERLTGKQIEAITIAAERRKDVPLVKAQQINMRFDTPHLKRAKQLAQAQGLPYTTFLTQLLYEDVDRLWSVFHRQ